ncbi:MAG: PfkB family carbohydrate kinase [Thermoflexales bacterium]|nr:PfkB family carbohydrate kinase [Thermoflexales bacterium]
MHSPTQAPLDYLAVGHVTEDVWRDGQVTAGGTVMYASLTARRLVSNVGVLTVAAPDFPVAQVFPGVMVRRLDAPQTTQFENIYTPQGRIQYVRPAPVVLTEAALDEWLWRSRIIHLAPVCDEVSASIAFAAPAQTFIGLTPQGWLRQWDEAGRVSPKAWAHAEALLARADAVVISIDDVAGDWRTLLRWAAQARLFVVTQSAEGCTLFLNGRPYTVPAPRVAEVDPTGAGDIFAAALFVALERGHDPVRACAFANCIAAQSVTRVSLQGLPTPQEVERCSKIVLENSM